MKNLFYFLLLGALISSSCGSDDDEETCMVGDFIGTYVGSETCDGETEDITYVVTQGSSEDKLIFTDDFQNVYNVDRKDCSLSGGESVFGIGVDYSGSLVGSDLTFTIESDAFLYTSTCSFQGTKQ